MRIAAVGSAFPEHYVDQDTLIAAFVEGWGPRYQKVARIMELHRNTLVAGRHLALPMDSYVRLQGFTEANDAWIRIGTDLGAAAIQDALARAGLAVRDVDALWCTSVTGIAVPSLDARLVNRLGFRPNIKRTPMFGLGCVAGAAGVSRAADYLKGHPDEVALLLSVELCSLTLQRDDLSIPNLIATGLFGDGAAAVVLVGTARGSAGPAIVATRSAFYPDTEGVMGWRIGESGFRVVLSAEVPEMVRAHLRGDVDALLAEHGLAYHDIAVWVAHPGGPKVLEAMKDTFPLKPGALDLSWESLRRVGNLSSASVLLVLQETLARAAPPHGSYGLMMAMGPGFCSELVLLQW
ncbi:MAG TPA: 3-oxoacyl-[acyl-carrier-protein] synthase III C-terminal domain-containing protein [Candidatus Methylomirabilis sp.]|nr:3-oxoacyl-[acyl-carrier-protein] synthase III C-terminal domain-containing protein [Candidatus Methylomirabilis sp.]